MKITRATLDASVAQGLLSGPIGFAIIGVGVAWQKREAAITAWFARLLPAALRHAG